MKIAATGELTLCYHCGNECDNGHFELDEKIFCCQGCREVYSVLSQSGLCNYYSYNNHPGATRDKASTRFDYLKEPSIIRDLVDYADEKFTVVTFYIPAIHCSSCIWLLEHMNKINPAVYHSRVDFLRKQVNIRFDNQNISLHGVVELLDRIGYEPLISLQDVIKKQNTGVKDNLVRKIAVAGFCFGNVMLLSFPEYLGISTYEQSFKVFFGWLNLAFCVPVVFYCATGYFKSAWANLRNKVLNIDFPLALGIAVLFGRTAFEVITGTGPGFADTCCGLVFFLSVGKFVQRKTYYHLSFERDYRSFFPVAVQVIEEEENERPVPLAEVKPGQRILIRNNEIIPADAILLKGEGKIDFSFVTGESVPVSKVLGEVVYAGGRQTGEAIELEVIKAVSQSYLTRLWNNEAFTRSQENRMKTFSETVSRYFSIVLLVIAFGSLFFWLPSDFRRALSAFTAVLIIACPCALALSTPFTMSAALSIFDKNFFYLKNTAVVEQLAKVDLIVLDKTGTLTLAGGNQVTFSAALSDYQKSLIYSACANSAHPLSRLICQQYRDSKKTSAATYREIPGLGIVAEIDGHTVRVGSRKFITGDNTATEASSTEVHVRIDDSYAGYFQIQQHYRDGIESIKQLRDDYTLLLLSGDYGHERFALADVIDPEMMFFEQSPQDKLEIIKNLQSNGRKVMMIGDGLNDAGALKQSDLGIAITDNVNNFSPGSDAILDGRALKQLPVFIKFAKDAVKVVHGSFMISLTYNLIGLSYAVTGHLSPLIAAILMPLSTATIISFTSIATHVAAKKRKLL